jgi:hypothetical protein
VLRRRQLALVAPIGIRGSDTNVFPIIELDASSCVLDTATAFELGQHLPIIEIVGERQVLRRCAASVFEVIPWCTPHGSRRFRCLLRLSENEPSHDGGMLETVADPSRVRRALEFAAMSSTLGWYESANGNRGEARFFDAGRDSLGLSLYPPRDDQAGARALKVGFSLFAVDYEMTVRILEETSTDVRTAFPLTVRRGRAFRREQASAESTQDLRLKFRNPVSGMMSVYPVTQLSLHKLACEVGAHAELLWEGLPLEDAHLCSAERDIPIGELRVTTVAGHGRQRRVELTIKNPERCGDLTKFVVSTVHSEVSVHDGHNFRSMLALYKDGGLFAPHMRDNLDPIVPQAKRVWHHMHQPNADLMQTFVHGPPDAPDGAASVLRAWEHGWVAQHIVSVSQQFNGAAGHLQLAFLDYVLRRSDGQYLLYFVKTDNHQMNAFNDRFIAATGTPEVLERRTVGFWHRLGSAREPHLDLGDCKVTAMRTSHEPVIARAAERLFGNHGALGLSFVPGEFGLPESEAAFKRLGLSRRRTSSVVMSGRGQPLWAAVEEHTSQGVNFTWMLNATWLFPVHGELDQGNHGLASALRHIVDKPKQTPTGDTFINSIGDLDAQTMQAAGFERIADVYMYVMNRAGLNRMFYFMSDRYGEVDARTQQRIARRSGIRLRSGESLTSIAPKVRAC